MASAGKKIKDYGVLSAPTANTKIVVSHNGNTYQMNLASAFANLSSNISISNTVSVFGVEVRNDATPANSTINVTKGSIWADSDYLYVAVANNTIKRIALETF